MREEPLPLCVHKNRLCAMSTTRCDDPCCSYAHEDRDCKVRRTSRLCMTLSTSTQSLPPINIELLPIQENNDDDPCASLSLLSLPSPPKAPSSFPHTLLWPSSLEWESSTVLDSFSQSAPLYLQRSQHLDLGPPHTPVSPPRTLRVESPGVHFLHYRSLIYPVYHPIPRLHHHESLSCPRWSLSCQHFIGRSWRTTLG